jgi:small subunit ribosomal protein S1
MTQVEAGAVSATNQTMADLLSEEYSYQRPQRGEIRTGTVMSANPGEIVVDVGVKREGLVSSRDLERLSAEDLAAISVGDEVPVYVVKPEDQDGNLIVSIYLAQVEQDWQEAAEYLKNKEIFEGQVTGYNKGGLVVPFGKIRGFVPASQVVGFPRRLSHNEKIERLAEQIGRELVVHVIEVDRKRKRLIMSEQAAQSEWRKQQRRKLMDSLVEGQVVRGVVTGLANFGAFVDLGGTDGLIHISELSWQRVRHPSEVVQIGDEVDVYVMKLDLESGRIGLSLRRLQPDPWTLVDTRYTIGQRVEGTITNVVDFGAFARLENGIEGLIHVSELSDAEINHPNDVVTSGDRYLLEIIKIEPERQRIGLSLKRVPTDEQVAWRAAQVTAAVEPVAESSASEPVEPEPVLDEVAEATAIAEGASLVEDGSFEAAPVEPEIELPGADDAPVPIGETESDDLPTKASPALQGAATDAGEPQLETMAEEPVA